MSHLETVVGAEDATLRDSHGTRVSRRACGAPQPSRGVGLRDARAPLLNPHAAPGFETRLRAPQPSRGAGRLRRLWHVVLPQLGPVILFNLVTGTVAAFQVFAQPYVMTQGGPGDASRFLVLYLYESAFQHLDVGYASVLAWVLVLVLALLCAAILLGARRWVHYRGGGLR